MILRQKIIFFPIAKGGVNIFGVLSQDNDTSTYFFNELTLKKHVGLVQSKFYHHLIEE
jgi:hypothetical protein